MKIAINCWVLRNKNLDGIGYYTINSVKEIIKSHPEVRFQILCDKNFTETYFDFPNVSKHPIFPALRHPFLYVFYIQIVMSIFLRRHRPNVLVSMDGFISLFSSTKQLPVIYDINFEHQPEGLKFWNRIYFRFFFKRFVKKADRIATISEYSKTDISEFYKIDKGKIDNVSAGINANFGLLDDEKIKQVRKKWSEEKPYFFFVGSMHPRKNIGKLIQAFSIFKRQSDANYKLLLAGSILWSAGEIKDAYEASEFKQDIVFTGRLSDQELQDVLGACFALSFVPLFEGFGLPVVEAMQSGVPVICSNVTSLPEVAGDAALLVDPLNVDAIAGCMKLLYHDNDLRSELVAKGFVQKEKFSWPRTGSLLWKSIKELTN